MNTSEVLNKAADLIEERGWVKGFFSARLCLESAIIEALGLSATEAWFCLEGDPLPFCVTPAYAAVADYLGITVVPRPSAPGMNRLWGWNDAPSRTAAEVIETLRACALIELARETEHAEAEAVSA